MLQTVCQSKLCTKSYDLFTEDWRSSPRGSHHGESPEVSIDIQSGAIRSFSQFQGVYKAIRSSNVSKTSFPHDVEAPIMYARFKAAENELKPVNKATNSTVSSAFPCSNMVDKSTFVVSELISVMEARAALVEEGGISVLVEIKEDKDAPPPEKLVNIQIPPQLKKQLIDDCEFVNHLGKK
ncbi:hypothetical protein K7X08_022424 [Anisodus acutangulus]|uniref:Uncharacterized protein n=1 Tax=Anisodus acutangulus TaxID=402998 RepID=A0A9Q1RKC4_9SOLA|nr:hypothetical protein K7X08_022424 [Anisodus acutangulus]